MLDEQLECERSRLRRFHFAVQRKEGAGLRQIIVRVGSRRSADSTANNGLADAPTVRIDHDDLNIERVQDHLARHDDFDRDPERKNRWQRCWANPVPAAADDVQLVRFGAREIAQHEAFGSDFGEQWILDMLLIDHVALGGGASGLYDEA
ncbi:MAG TPA: hypothetical protein VFQ80_07490 [Thermomicrobiales bacterium]|nr:hypothetical protein [Thermomicrobiales bacterium]